MKMLLTFLVAFAFSLTANAQAYYQRFERDIKPATQKVLELQSWDNLQAASQGYNFASAAGNTSASAVVKTTGITNPDYARNLKIIPDSNTSHVNTCTIVVAGTDISNNSISENFVFAASASTVQTGSKAFKTISSVTFPANCEVAPYDTTWSLGIGEKIGLKRCIDAEGDWFQSALNGTLEATRATVVASASVLSGNTADFNGTMNGSNDFKAYYVQNYRCH